MQLSCVILWIIICVVCFEHSNQHEDFKKQGSTAGPPQVTAFKNLSVLIKMKVEQQMKGNNSKTLHIKGYRLKSPDVSKIRFNHSHVTPEDPKNLRRSRRHVINLYNMISCGTGCSPWKYKGYGCYCGFLGSGDTVDGIDRCCEMHDSCYSQSGCYHLLHYVVPYSWKCDVNQPLCAIENGPFGGPDSCASKLCECDQFLSVCLSRHPCPRTRPVCSSSVLRRVQNVFMGILD